MVSLLYLTSGKNDMGTTRAEDGNCNYCISVDMTLKAQVSMVCWKIMEMVARGGWY